MRRHGCSSTARRSAKSARWLWPSRWSAPPSNDRSSPLKRDSRAEQSRAEQSKRTQTKMVTDEPALFGQSVHTNVGCALQASAFMAFMRSIRFGAAIGLPVTGEAHTGVQHSGSIVSDAASLQHDPATNSGVMRLSLSAWPSDYS